MAHSSKDFCPIRDEDTPCLGALSPQLPEAELPSTGRFAGRKILSVSAAIVLGLVALAGFTGSMPLTRRHYSSPMDALGLAEEINSNATTPGGNGILIRLCRNMDCDKYHPHGLVHEYSVDLNTCAKVTDENNDNTAKTNGEYQVVGVAPNATLSNGLVLTAEQCGEVGDVYHPPFSLIIGAFTDCCSFYYGGCGFKCITFDKDNVPAEYQ